MQGRQPNRRAGANQANSDEIQFVHSSVLASVGNLGAFVWIHSEVVRRTAWTIGCSPTLQRHWPLGCSPLFWLEPKVAMLQTTLQRGAVSGVLRHLHLCENLLRVLSTSLRAATRSLTVRVASRGGAERRLETAEVFSVRCCGVARRGYARFRGDH